MMRPLIVRKSCLQEDSWTHGNWKQYIAFIDDDTVVVCRRAVMPVVVGLLGLAVLTLALMVAVTTPFELVHWDRLFSVAVGAFFFMAPAIIELFTDWRWMVPVARPMKRHADGSFWRDYYDD
jgi:hypothetical protein